MAPLGLNDLTMATQLATQVLFGVCIMHAV